MGSRDTQDRHDRAHEGRQPCAEHDPAAARGRETRVNRVEQRAHGRGAPGCIGAQPDQDDASQPGRHAAGGGRRSHLAARDGAAQLIEVCPGVRPLAVERLVQRDAERELTSDRASAGPPASCSGAMYAGVPTSAPVCVIEESAGRVSLSCALASVGACAAARARPKSVTRTRPSVPTSTLSGLKSRWTKPAACAASRPSPASRSTDSTSRHVRPGARIQSVRVPPSTSSIETKTSSSIVPTS